ncbi:MAG: hypothetical protein SFY80_06370 [Verrucomicrobiota bacterium]|nr:hypothetical protein [Verrucomicrobiota bacterium]
MNPISKFLPYFRLMTYAMIIAIAFMYTNIPQVIPVVFSQQEDAPGPDFVTDPLVSWLGKDEAWIKTQLGDALWEHAIELPVPEIGVYSGVQAKIVKQIPQYNRGLRSLIAKKGPRYFQVFLIQPAESWVVIDAVSWQEGVLF